MMMRAAIVVAMALLASGCSEPLVAPTAPPSTSPSECRLTPVSDFGRVGGNLAARSSETLLASSEIKVLWVLRMPHGDGRLRLSVERLDGPGTGAVTGLSRSGPSIIPPPSGWERAAFYPSEVTFDSPGCWRIRDLDGTADDAVVVEVRSR